jgi:NADH-quinone oxidoreductase subunit H
MDSATDMDFWGGYVLPGVIIVLQIVAIIAPLMVAVAYLTLA